MKDIYSRYKTTIFSFIIFVILFIVLPIGIASKLTTYPRQSQFWGLEGKTVWDYFELLILPLTLLSVTVIFQLMQQDRDNRNAQELQKRDQQFQENLLDKELLGEYFNAMNHYIEKLESSELEQKAFEKIVTAYTYTFLANIQGVRQMMIFQYLHHHHLLNFKNVKWHFENMYFMNSDFWGVDFGDASFSACRFESCWFKGIRLIETQFHDCSFIDSWFEGINFYGTIFLHCNFSSTKLNMCRFYRCQFFDPSSLLCETIFRNVMFAENTFHKINNINAKFKNCVSKNNIFPNYNDFILNQPTKDIILEEEMNEDKPKRKY